MGAEKAHHRADVEKEVPIGRKSPLNSSPEIGEVPAGRRGMTKAKGQNLKSMAGDERDATKAVPFVFSVSSAYGEN